MKSKPNSCSHTSAGPALFNDWPPRTLFPFRWQRPPTSFEGLMYALGRRLPYDPTTTAFCVYR
jgi:hypothetical protein